MLYILLLAIVIVCVFYPVAAIVSCFMEGSIIGITIFIGLWIYIIWWFAHEWKEMDK